MRHRLHRIGAITTAALLMLAALAILARPVAAQVGPPAAPTNCTATRSGFYGSILAHVTWTDNSANEASFVAEKWRRSGASWALAQSYTTGPDATALGAAVTEGTWRFRVKATNAAGESAWSNWAELTIKKNGR
jgi:hypothetical protein